jgi:hypothetical protein
MCADGIVVFLKHVNVDITALAQILDNFVQVTSLHTDISKRNVALVCCSQLDLDREDI